jgi:signal transduction histidine kinase
VDNDCHPWTTPGLLTKIARLQDQKQLPRLINTLVGRLAILQLAVQLVLPPILFYRLDAVVRANASRTFTLHAHAYARSLANELELGDILHSPSRTIVFLDAIVQGGGCSYAAIEHQGLLTGSSLTETPEWIQRRGNDRNFPSSPRSVYALTETIRMSDGHSGMLYLGFDPTPTFDEIQTARNQILVALVFYALASVGAAVWFACLVSQPLTRLQKDSRIAARGDPGQRLGTDSSMVEIVELARDLEYMRGELVGTAAELRAEMRQREIAQAEREALENHLRHEQRLATMGTFAGGLAHELNNILQPLTLYLEEALDDVAPSHPARGNLERVLTASTRASDVVSKVLAFSRPLTVSAPRPFDPRPVLEEVLDLFGALMPSAIRLSVMIAPQPLRILGDATQFSQVILNLLSNAVHAMRDTGGKLEVTLKERPSDALPAIELRVKDGGVGMSPEIRERIFEPFFTTRGVGEGTGLGLSVVHGIVVSMGGAIRVESEPDAGAEFVVVVPAAPGAAVDF